MLRGLSDVEFNQLMLSVGKTPIAQRPFSPAEVGHLCKRAKLSGSSNYEITVALRMKDTSMISKFIRVADLSPGIQHLVAWGRSGGGVIGFSAAAQLGRFDKDHQELIASEVIKYDLTKSEMISIIQLFARSGQPLIKCVERVISRRPTVTVRDVIVGAVSSHLLRQRLSLMTQRARNGLLESVVKELYPRIGDFTASLGDSRFALVGGRALSDQLTKRRDFESGICSLMLNRTSNQ